MQSSLKEKIGLGFKPPLQNVKDQPSTSYVDALKGNEDEENILETNTNLQKNEA